MNLKEAFRFQNKLQALVNDATVILSRDSNVTKTERTYLYKKVMPEIENETIADEPNTEYADNITELTGFVMWLLSQQAALAKGIRAAKNKLPIDMDAEVSLNKRRQQIAEVFQDMTQLRSTEILTSNGGTGYRFNAEGNQVSYRCDVKKVTTINFDRNMVRKHLTEMNKQIDAVSSELDRCLVNAEVEYDTPFDVNDSFADAFGGYLEASAT